MACSTTARAVCAKSRFLPVLLLARVGMPSISHPGAIRARAPILKLTHYRKTEERGATGQAGRPHGSTRRRTEAPGDSGAGGYRQELKCGRVGFRRRRIVPTELSAVHRALAERWRRRREAAMAPGGTAGELKCGRVGFPRRRIVPTELLAVRGARAAYMKRAGRRLDPPVSLTAIQNPSRLSARPGWSSLEAIAPRSATVRPGTEGPSTHDCPPTPRR